MIFFKQFQITFLIIITIASFTLRFYQLGKVPNGLTVDEADMGYNTYSILKTGKDVYGEKLPLFFQALDDYKPGLVFYSSIPAVSAFGLNDFSIRLAPAIFGVLSIILIYAVTKQLYSQNQFLPYISTILIVFAPWHIALSRAMLWYSQLVFFYLLSFLLLFYSLKKNSWFIIPAAFFLALTLYIYYAAIIYLPFLIVILFLIYRQDLLKNYKTTLLAAIIFLIAISPAAIHYMGENSKTRLNAISILTPDVTLPTSISELQFDINIKQPFAQLIHNRRPVYLSSALDNYFDYFNLDYLFVTAKNIRYFYINNVGLFYLIELPFFLYGLYILARRREKSDILLLALLIIGPIPAMITLGSPFPHRGILLILTLQIISAIGLATFVQGLVKSKVNFKVHVMVILAIVYLSNVYFFLHQYFIHSPREFTSELDNGAWFSTVRDAIPIVNKYKNDYEKIIFTWSSWKLVPGVYYLFYKQTDPRLLQAKAALWTIEPPSYKQIYNRIDKIEFRSINWEQDKNLKKTLFVGYQKEFDQDAQIIDRTYLPNGQTHFVFVQTQ